MGPTPEPQLAFPRPLAILLGTAAAVLTFAGLRAISDILAPVFLALVLTIMVHPVGPWLRGKGWPGWAATTVLVVMTYVVIVGLAVSVVVSVARFAALLPDYQDQFTKLVDNVVDQLKTWGIGQEQISTMSGAFDPGAFASWLGSLLAGLAGLVSDLVFIVMLLLFMVADASWFPGRLSLAPSDKTRVVAAFGDFAHGTRRYLVVSTIFGAIVAILDALALWIIGVPVPLLWGLLAFITNYIPNIGFVIGLIPPAVLGLLEGGWGMALTVVLVYCLINLVLQSVIQPKFVGDAVGLSVSLTFLSLVFWAWVLGPLGALLAIPLTLFVKALLVDSDPGNNWLRPLLGDLNGTPDGAGRVAVEPPAKQRRAPSVVGD